MTVALLCTDDLIENLEPLIDTSHLLPIGLHLTLKGFPALALLVKGPMRYEATGLYVSGLPVSADLDGDLGVLVIDLLRSLKLRIRLLALLLEAGPDLNPAAATYVRTYEAAMEREREQRRTRRRSPEKTKIRSGHK